MENRSRAVETVIHSWVLDQEKRQREEQGFMQTLASYLCCAWTCAWTCARPSQEKKISES